MSFLFFFLYHPLEPSKKQSTKNLVEWRAKKFHSSYTCWIFTAMLRHEVVQFLLYRHDDLIFDREMVYPGVLEMLLLLLFLSFSSHTIIYWLKKLFSILVDPYK